MYIYNGTCSFFKRVCEKCKQFFYCGFVIKKTTRYDSS